MAWIVKVGVAKYLTQSEMENNANEFYGYFNSKGFTIESISGMLGNLQQESNINPGMKQTASASSGWGLIQWTPSSNLTDYANAQGSDWATGEIQTQLMWDEIINGTYNRYYKDKNGNIHDSTVIMTVTMTDYKLMLKHYELVDFEILDGCWFYSDIGIFDNYINHYAEIKMNSKGAKRAEAKLFLNNLYGKLASSSNSSFKVAYVKEDESIGFYIVPANNKKVGHIATGSAITSYARNFTITAAQKNYYGVDKAGFIYADTDSIHCDLPADQIKGITVDPVKFCCWKLESSWDTAIFTRQKTYIEHITHNDLVPVDEPYNDIKCAGMPQKCKDLFNKSMQGYEAKGSDNYTQSELKFLETKRDYSDFKVGLCVPGKLLPKRIKGGVLLVDTTYEMR